MRLIWIILFAFFACNNIMAAVKLTEEGKAVGTIVIPKKSLAVVDYAAKELQYHIKQASGAELPIVREDRPHPGRNCIYLGNCQKTKSLQVDKLPPNAFIIEPQNGNLILAGHDGNGYYLTISTPSGTLFAVYEFLDRYLGVKWLWPGKSGELIPHIPTITVDVEKQSWIPQLVNTDLYLPAVYRNSNGWKNKDNWKTFFSDLRVWMKRHRFRSGKTVSRGHAFTKWWKKYGKSHPEFFNLLPNGKREPLPENPSGSNISMCVSQPALHEFIIEQWKQERQKNPGININACENDTPGLCVCESCRKWDDPNPREIVLGFEGLPGRFNQRVPDLTERYARFYAELLKKAQKVDPRAEIFAYAYANYVSPPKLTKLDPAVTIGIVPRSMHCPWDKELTEKFFSLCEGWKNSGCSLFYRPNDMLIGHNMPVNFSRELLEKFQFAYKRGMTGTFFDSLTGQFATQGPLLYMLARMHNRPEASADSILEEYYKGFGKASGAVKKYFQYWESVTRSVNSDKMKELMRKTRGSYNNWYVIAPYIFTDKIMVQGRKLLEAAAAAAKGDPAAEGRIAILWKGLHNAELTLTAQKSWQIYKENPNAKTQKAHHEALRQLYDYRGKIEASIPNNMSYLAFCEGRNWDLAVLKRPGGAKLLTSKWKFSWDQKTQGQVKGFYKKEYDDSKWDITTVGAWEKLPVGEKWRREHGKDYNGIAWYRCSFRVSRPASENTKIILLFGSVDESCTIWLNGQKMLVRKYDKKLNPNSWQEPFDVDITKVVSFDSDNTLAVEVEDIAGAGGITRDVYIQEQAATQGENLVKNGNFSTGRLAPWKTSFPKGRPKGTETRIVDNEKLKSFYIKLTEPAYLRLSQSGIPLQKNKRYKFCASYKTGAEFSGSIKISLAGGGKVTPKIKAFNTDDSWKKMEKVFTASSEQLYLLFSLTAKGEFQITNISVYQIKESK